MMEVDLGGPYDVVLLDAPCSATGTLRRHPDVAWLKRESDIATLARQQAAMLDRAAAQVGDGGLLIYSTCSLEPEEGEQQVTSFLVRNRGFALDPIAPDEIGGFSDMVAGVGTLRSRPDMLKEDGGIDGFFVARLRKIAQD
jgi:16S rRNA (cytosine967-C5)-methyltransferase